jgi:hypothetical protein
LEEPVTDKNQAALDAFKRLCLLMPGELPYDKGHQSNLDMILVKAALQSLTAHSAGVDVSRDALDKIIGSCVRAQNILPEGIAGWGIFTSIKEIAIEALTSIPDMREAKPVDVETLCGTLVSFKCQHCGERSFHDIPDMREAPEDVTVEDLNNKWYAAGHTYPNVWEMVRYHYPNGLRIKAAPKGGKL